MRHQILVIADIVDLERTCEAPSIIRQLEALAEDNSAPIAVVKAARYAYMTELVNDDALHTHLHIPKARYRLFAKIFCDSPPMMEAF